MCSILRVHAFLEHWGLINFESSLTESSYGDIVSDPTFIPHIYKYNPDEGKSKNSNFVDKLELLEKSVEENYIEHDLHLLRTVKQLSRHIRPICSVTGLPCGAVWFKLSEKAKKRPLDGNLRDIVNADYTISLDTYFQRKYPILFTQEDFIKCDLLSHLNNTNRNSKPLQTYHCQEKKWTNNDFTNLLSTIKKHKGKNWGKICSEMKEFSQEEIIFNFLKLPFINISNMKLMKNQDNLQGKLAENEPVETGLLKLVEEDGKIRNPLKPHVSLVVKSDRNLQRLS